MLRTKQSRVLLLLTVCLFAVPALQPIASAQQMAAPQLVVNTSYLNVRSGPGVGHSVIATVPGGTALPATMIGAGGNWYQVRSPAGVGWVNVNYTVGRGDFSGLPNQNAPANLGSGLPGAASRAHVVVNTAYLNVRTGPGVGHPILTTVRGGAELAVSAIAGDRVWYKVETSAGSGWLNSRYTSTRGNFSGVMREPAPGTPSNLTSGTAIPAGAPRLVVNTAYLNVRTGPGVGHRVLTVARGGTELLVKAIDGGRVWHQVATSAGDGWVNSNYTVGRGDFSQLRPALEGGHLGGATPRAVVNTNRLNIRSGPGVGHAIVTSVPGGTILKILGISGSRRWYKVEGSFGQGWLNNHYTVFRGDYSQVAVVG